MTGRTALGIGLFFLSSMAAAQPPTPSPPASSPAQDSAYAAALDLLEPEKFKAQALEGAIRMAQAGMDSELKQQEANGVVVPPDLVQKIRFLTFQEAKDTIEAIGPEMRREAAGLYARHFTAAELRELKQLMSNPVLKKMEGVAPEIMADLTRLTLDRAAGRRDAFRERVTEEIGKWEEQQKNRELAPTS